ncbi:hypothetical protein ACKTEK_02770 [Tepidamorphus sp. 3E244]|uniref:hypothetical protein n=1 Tax=Tepidamorphus sp. 3E244 TaxID=3385498 RepID=UPI0038FC4488
MFLRRTISQLDIGPVTPERAQEMAQLGFLQWLAGRPAKADHRSEALDAYAVARPLAQGSPAIAAFCDLLLAATKTPVYGLPIRLPTRQRRGGAQARRAWRSCH